MAAIVKEELTIRMQSSPFSISIDGSSDSDSKQYPLVVPSFDQESGTVNSELLSIAICDGFATGINIFNLIDNAFKERSIPWKNCIAIGSDNAGVMTGKENGVIAHVRKLQPCIILAGCSLHLVHIGAMKGVEHLLPVDTVLTDIFYYLKKSSKRKTEFANLQDMYIKQKKC